MSKEQTATAEQQKAWIERHGITPPPGFHAIPAPFTIASGAMRVTDPCYDMDTWCAGTLDDVKNGVWFGTSFNQIDDWTWGWLLGRLPLQGLKYDDTPPIDPKETFAKISNLLSGLTEVERVAKLLDLQEQFGEFGVGERLASLIITLWDEALSADKRADTFTRWLSEDEGMSFGMGDTRKEYLESLEAMKNGDISYRCHWLTAIHEDYKDDPRFQPDQLLATLQTAEISEICVGVDSGQAGLFDLHQFINKDDVVGQEAFYDKACIASYPESRINPDRDETSARKPNANPVQYDGAETAMGFNASSGYGDGSYRLRVVRDEANQVIFANIMFIIPNELDDDEDTVEEE